jgi:transcriptional repressor NrdR
MKCPFCDADNTRVIDSRPADDNHAIRRRRQCDKCMKRFTSFEKVEMLPFMIVKKDQTREVYDRAKLEGGIYRSLHKRPVPAEEINAAIDDIENTIFMQAEREISSSRIGEIVMNRLKELDPVAYVRFASVYREFKDVGTFMEELKKILDA